MHTTLNQVPTLCPVAGVGFILLEGEDTGRFLHSQLSQDVQTLGPGEARLAAWHSAAGKVMAIIRVLRLDDSWLLVTEKDLVAPVITDLRRFVLRDQVTIRDGGDQWRAAALLGESDRWLREHDIDLGHDSGQRFSAHGLIWLRLGRQLVHTIGPPAGIAELETTLPRGESDDAALMEVSLGLPRLTPALQSRFIPQMLNLDLLGALNESKGCYPGQEIIARTQNLGTVKRRMLRFSADLRRVPEIGTAIMDENGATVGEVIRSAMAEGRVEFLAVTQLDSIDRILSCEVDRTVGLRVEPLPYESR